MTSLLSRAPGCWVWMWHAMVCDPILGPSSELGVGRPCISCMPTAALGGERGGPACCPSWSWTEALPAEPHDSGLDFQAPACVHAPAVPAAAGSRHTAVPVHTSMGGARPCKMKGVVLLQTASLTSNDAAGQQPGDCCSSRTSVTRPGGQTAADRSQPASKGFCCF